MNRMLSCALSSATVLLFATAAARAAEVTCSPPQGEERQWCGDAWERCSSTTHWTEPVDLDGDGMADFLHRRVTALGGCGDEYGGYGRQDEIDAFYPEEHVDVWIQYHTSYPTDPYWAVAVQPGEMVGDPSYQDCGRPTFLCRTWASERPIAQPTLDARGIGFAWSRTDHRPCEQISCSSGRSSGAMEVVQGDTFNETLIGLRIVQPDGRHLGWLRLQWFLDQFPIGHVELAEYAIHPEPDTPIAAGEAPRPTLYAAVEGDEVVLSWHPAWTDYRLERSPSVTGASWQDVPGVENNTVHLPKTGPPAFFRITQP